jgi:UV DNA damage endonuclease
MTIPCNINLGYACINTELRKKGIFMSRTLRLATLESKGIKYAQELAIQNLKDLYVMLKWNKEHNISFMRLSSDMFPFGSHPVHGYSLDFAAELLQQIGDYAKQNKMRLTFHPGQYNVLSSPKKEVIKNTTLDLNHHCDILDRMGLNQNSVMVIHGGGVYNDKESALKRLEENLLCLPKATRDRLVLENCEMSFCVEDLLPISELLQIPIILDFHHDDIHPSSNKIESFFQRVFQVWFNRGIKPKVHVSNSIDGCGESKTARRKHSDFITFLHEPLLKITFPIDVMLECKMKEQALFGLRDQTKK